MQKKLGRKFWTAMIIFGLMGQVAWVVENMYFNVFIYKMFHASAADISAMVSASAVAATVTTLLMGALSDKVGKRKLFMCLGYLVWGISILSFALIRVDILTPIAGSAAAAAGLGITLVIIMDCVMTFFGSTANDAAYNAWLTDMGDETNRGKIEGFNSMMPLVSILVVFGGFMGFNLDKAESWTAIYIIIGAVVLIIGILGFFLIEEPKQMKKSADPYWQTLVYSFRPSVLMGNRQLYAVLGAFALFGISIQIFMPYLIIYYEQSLQMTNYVFIMAPAIILAAVFTALYGKVYDKHGFKAGILPSLALLMAGYIILTFTRATALVFIGSLLMMCGYLSGMAVFGAMIRDRIPQQMSGRFQGVRIIGQVLIPGIIGPAIGAWVLRDAEVIVNSDGTTSFLPNASIFSTAAIVIVVLLVVLIPIFSMKSPAPLAPKGGGKPKKQLSHTPWSEHPRPQMKRDSWHSLDGVWQLNGQPIVVPFPPQSPLSGWEGDVPEELHYETTFTVPQKLRGQRLLLHFGAADQVAEVTLNDRFLGRHEGGYLPFSFDITDCVTGGENHLTVKAVDSLSHYYPYGKQTNHPKGMWYTPVSGIWQTIWLEQVPEQHITSLTVTPDLNGVDISVEGVTGFSVTADGREYTFEGSSGRIEISNPHLWTRDDPYLYPITVTAGEDRVESYFALRTISIEEKEGINRVCLNGKPIFLHGVLDQGYFPDGIFLPAQPAEFEADVRRMKELGLNLLRKHIKIEPEYFYYACDRLGMLVMQDMVNNGGYSFLRDTALPTVGMKRLRDDRKGLDARKKFFLQHSEDTIRHLHNHPCVVAYTIFNEGWGQFRADEAYDRLKALDPTRLYDAASGWFAQSKSDFDSEHIYFRVKHMEPKTRPLLVSECGGYTLDTAGRTDGKKTYGYGKCRDSGELTLRIVYMYREMILPSIKDGLCGCVYTQLSDVEGEINGLYTYDRKLCKVDRDAMLALADELNSALL